MISIYRINNAKWSQYFQVFNIARYYSKTFATVDPKEYSHFEFSKQFFLGHEKSKFVVAVNADNLVIGYAQVSAFWHIQENRTYLKVYVRPSFSRLGIGKALVSEALKQASGNVYVEFLEVFKSPMPHHENSIGIFFEKLGFSKVKAASNRSKFGLNFPLKTMVRHQNVV